MLSRERYQRIAEVYLDMVYRIAYSRLGNRSDAEDAAQNVMLRLWRSDLEDAPDDHVRYWLCRVALNESKRIFSAPWRRHVVPLEQAGESEAGHLPGNGVLQAVMSLPEKYRLPLYLYYFEGYSVEEAAKLLNRKPSTVQTQLARGRERLKHILEEEGSL